ncbi:protein lifeguard 3 isoform X3 [Physeter macrocephalus]|uniref:Protein lifeguard 3 isoform X3 n=1 Tax=Physeter macrocephalus TaxID=9755 RepID=A0A455BAS5_PHYMC|nr:protein lifeguard 3 isoform X3 [Physeter catodon]|eukprot:XP_028341081.1 protein lifeguard 3 isoform X3 [Physeter catodon]
MSHPSAPPPYEDRNPLYPDSLPPGAYGQPSVLPGGYPAYPQPGYGHPAGYPQPMPPIHPTPMNYGPGQGYDGEERAVSDNFGSGEWSDRKVRHAFIRKVYTIISIQLLITVAIIAVFTFVKPVSEFVKANLAVYYASYAVFLVTYLTLACCQGPRRRFPWNIILLTLFTLAMGYMTGTIARFTGCTWSMLLWGPFASLCSWLTTHSWSWGTGGTPSARRTTSPAPCRSTQTLSTSLPLCCSSWGIEIREHLPFRPTLDFPFPRGLGPVTWVWA